MFSNLQKGSSMKNFVGMILVTALTVFSTGCVKEKSFSNTEKNFDRYQFRNTAKRHVVKVMGLEGGHGSGFVTIHKGKSYIISNRHVCNIQKDEDYMYIQYAESDVKHLVKKIKIAKEHDLCALENVRSTNFGGFKLAEKMPRIGEQVFSFGFPHGSPATMMDGEFTGEKEIYMPKEYEKDGSCDGLEKELNTFFGTLTVCGDNYPTFQTTTTVYPGNSGSALINQKGEAIGVIFAKGGAIVENFSVPLDYLKRFVEGL